MLLGKTVIDCRDTPGFIANRIGCFWMAHAALEAKRRGLTIEEADAANAAFGVPRTGGVNVHIRSGAVTPSIASPLAIT